MTAHPQSPIVELIADLVELDADDILDELTEHDCCALGACWELWARPDQLLPPDDDWDLFAFIGARGDGKTTAVAWWIHHQAMTGEPKEMLFCAQTLPDTIKVCVGLDIDPKTKERRGKPAGIMRAAPPWERPVLKSKRGGGHELIWPTGSRATLTSAETTEQRGSEWDIVWLTEVVAWPRNKRMDVWANIGIATRTGEAKMVVDSTPKRGHPIVSTKAGVIAKEAEWNPRTQWRGGSLERNWIHLARGYIERERSRWDGTRRGKEELDGVDADEGGGLIHDEWIEQGRRNMPSVWKQRIVCCDPTVTHPKPGGHTAGLVSGGEGIDGQIYVTRDQSGMMGPDTWAVKLIDEAIAVKADAVVIETNRGGNVIDFALSLVARQRGLDLRVVELMANVKHSPGVINLKLVHSRKDKETRMDPAIVEYKAGRVSHCKEADLEDLEETLTTWEPETASNRDSPGDLDCVAMLVVEARRLYDKLKAGVSGADMQQLNEAARQLHQQATEQARRPVGYLRQTAGRGRERDTRSRI